MTEKWPEGLAQAIESLKPLVTGSYANLAEAQRRVWRARDEVERLRRLLADAEIALASAERDYEHNGEETRMIWNDFRESVMKIPVRDAAPPQPPEGAEAGNAGLSDTDDNGGSTPPAPAPDLPD